MSGINGIGRGVDYGTIASGNRINSAADDASGLAIANKLQSQTNGLDVGASNAEDGKNVLNIADGALSGMTDSLQRIRELSVKASNGLLSASDRQAIQDEIDQNLEGIQQLAKGTEYNTMKLLDGSMADMHIASNPDGSGMDIQMVNSTLQALGIDGYDVTGNFDISKIDSALEKLNSSRSSLGAATNRLDYAAEYNRHTSIQQTDAFSRIKDLDMPKAVSELKKKELLTNYKNLMLRKRMDDESMVTRLFR